MATIDRKTPKMKGGKQILLAQLFGGTVLALDYEMPPEQEIVVEEMMPMAANGTCHTSPNQMQKMVERGQAPRGVLRVDNWGDNPWDQPHVHFTDGSAINLDGTAHHGTPVLSNDIRDWLLYNGWGVN